ncbi:MAG: hypothetical protein EA425_02875 [Puniceicoccaceae bacterium]|nr:MAG: hypothetical protein EA425_02875 [Puniceicoccaceae bacterium]
MPEIPVTSLDPRMQKQVENARFAMDRGNTEYTINICEEILRKAPGCIQVRRLLRAAQRRIFKTKNRFVAKATAAITTLPLVLKASGKVKKDPEAALDLAERALNADPTNVAALKIIAQAARKLELPETVVFAHEAIREAAPNNIQNLFALGEAYIEAKQPEDALHVGEALLKLKPGEGRAQELIKNASVAQSIHSGKWESDSGTFRDKLRDESTAVSIEQSNKVVTSEEMTRRLIEETKAKVKAEPNNLNYYRSLVQQYKAIGELDAAIEWLDKARELPSGAADSNLEKQRADLELQKLERKLSELEKKLALEPENAEVKAAVDQQRMELQEARLQQASNLVHKYPNDNNYRYELGRLYFERGMIDEAIQQFQASQRNPKLRFSSLSYLGSCFMEKGLFDLAVQQLESAKGELSQMDDLKKETIYQLAVCYEKMGQPEKALEHYKTIYSSDIGFRDVAEKINTVSSKKEG